MSVRVMAWVFEHSTARLGDRLVLLALADNANDEGGDAYPSQKVLSEKALVSERQVRRCLRNLIADGHIVDTGEKSRFGTVIYSVVMGNAKTASTEADNMTGRSNQTKKRSEMSAEPSLEPSSVSEEQQHLEQELALEPRSFDVSELQSGTTRARVNGSRWKVDRKEVQPAEAELAKQVLGFWNEQTGQSLRSKDWLAKIVMRIREYPEFGLAEHQHVIQVALSDPWWSGSATPSVVYGNGAQFERCLERVRAGPSASRDISASEILALGRDWASRGLSASEIVAETLKSSRRP